MEIVITEKSEKVSAEFRKEIEESLKTTIIENFQKEMVEEGFYKYEVQLQSIKFVTYMSHEELEKSKAETLCDSPTDSKFTLSRSFILWQKICAYDRIKLFW